MPTRLETNLDALRARIERALAIARRPLGGVRLVAVTKSASAATARELARLLGDQPDLGENRVQELAHKAEDLAAHEITARWHLVGHLQTNKVRRALKYARVLHSIDSTRLLDFVQRVAEEDDRRPRVYFEVELTGLPGRAGFAPEQLPAAARHAQTLDRIELAGLMTIGPPPAAGGDGSDQAPSRAVFARLRELGEHLEREVPDAFAQGRPQYSMGMTSDLEAAILEGSDCLRIGSALFEGVEAGRGVEAGA